MIVYGRRNGTDYSSIFDGLYPKEIEIWGRNDNNVTKFDPENDEGWVRLYQGVLPRADGSVIPAAIVPLTDADKELARDGNELEFSVAPLSFQHSPSGRRHIYGCGKPCGKKHLSQSSE